MTRPLQHNAHGLVDHHTSHSSSTRGSANRTRRTPCDLGLVRLKTDGRGDDVLCLSEESQKSSFKAEVMMGSKLNKAIDKAVLSEVVGNEQKRCVSVAMFSCMGDLGGAFFCNGEFDGTIITAVGCMGGAMSNISSIVVSHSNERCNNMSPALSCRGKRTFIFDDRSCCRMVSLKSIKGVENTSGFTKLLSQSSVVLFSSDKDVWRSNACEHFVREESAFLSTNSTRKLVPVRGSSISRTNLYREDFGNAL
mmetsp:Transcript_36225/g.60287  ORF Transcript_36225/g.60287 Transcript_36225/m.60287 type:complete len:251 (-) Transcript_36225:190-942(-)